MCKQTLFPKSDPKKGRKKKAQNNDGLHYSFNLTLLSISKNEHSRFIGMQTLQLRDDLSQVHQRIHKAKKMVVLTGAGISCNAGIPDFRSSNGLYNMAECNTNIKGKDLFDISLFNSEDTIRCFAKFMSALYSSALQAQPTRTHRFIQEQRNRGKLLRCYTQNIDGLEARVGLNMSYAHEGKATLLQKWKKLNVVQLHGDLNTLTCTSCLRVQDWETEHHKSLQNGELPECPKCIEQLNTRMLMGKRCTGNVGVLRPNIVLYGENHPQSEIITTGLNSDMKTRPDLLIIMGTSLKVHGVRTLVKSISKVVHSRGGIVVLVNKDPLAGWNGIIDYQIQSDCDQFVDDLQKHEKVQASLQTPPTTPKKKYRIQDVLNTPSPSPSPSRKRKKLGIFNDPKEYPTPEESPRKSPRCVKVIDFNINREIATPKEKISNSTQNSNFVE